MEKNEAKEFFETENTKSDGKKNVENGKKPKKEFSLPKVRLYVKIVFLLFLVLIIVGGIMLFVGRSDDGKMTTISKSSLQKVIEINELSTIDYTYNATAIKRDENNEAMYYVAYEGIVTAGIDFNEIEIAVIEKEKKVHIAVPKVEIQGVKVDMGTMEYIFTKNKYETEDITQEAYKLCKADLKMRVEEENVLYDTARENAISSVEALFEPWIETIDDSYTIEVA